MRTVLFSWTVGLVGLVSVSGCGSLPFYRERTTDQATTKSTYAPPVTVTYEDYDRDRRAASSLPKVVDAPWPTAPAATCDAKPPAVLPPRRIELNAQGLINAPEVAVAPEIAKKIELPRNGATVTPALKENPPENIPIKNANVPVGALDQYKSIVGQVQQFRKTWRLRYAPFDQDDPYGGSVMLEGADLDRLRDGQRIRIQGEIIPPTDRTRPARYRVRTMEILE
jgi:hypothetical protein